MHAIRYGVRFAGLVDGLVRRVSKEISGKPKVIATGELADMEAPNPNHRNCAHLLRLTVCF
jgi:pantothenate kinase type III